MLRYLCRVEFDIYNEKGQYCRIERQFIRRSYAIEWAERQAGVKWWVLDLLKTKGHGGFEIVDRSHSY